VDLSLKRGNTLDGERHRLGGGHLPREGKKKRITKKKNAGEFLVDSTRKKKGLADQATHQPKRLAGGHELGGGPLGESGG